MKWWHYLCNIDVIVTIILVIFIIYFFFTERRKRQKYEFKGLGKNWRHEISKYDKKNNPYKEEFEKEFTPLFGVNGSSKSRRHSSRHSGYTDGSPPRRHKRNKHEEKCRDIFQDTFKAPFKSVRPDWLKNPVTGKNLELDGFNKDIKTPVGTGLAFEYDGEQHAKYNRHFHRKGPIEFEYQVKKDTWKDLKCKERGILLMRIPHYIDYYDLESYIKDKLRTLGILPSFGGMGYTPPPFGGNIGAGGFGMTTKNLYS